LYEEQSCKMPGKALPLRFEYKNWQGQTAVRTVMPIEVWYGKTEFHPDKQWFLRAMDVDKAEERNFAVRDIIKFL